MPAPLEQVAASLRTSGRRVSAHVVDVSNREAMAELAREVIALHGECHVLVNNAGVAVDGRIEDVSAEDFEWIVGVNFWGVVHGARPSSRTSAA
jgi:NAD(P)-dependent dehydrogenase (short-subunit alcohol dehydrogenase family)